MAKTAILVVAFCIQALSALGSNGDEIVGIWNTEDQKAKIEIFPCHNHYCGKIAALKEPTYPADDERGMGGQPVVDRENPDRDLRGRPLVGLVFMKGITYSGDNTWQNGTIYDPENGKTYKGKITLESSTRLKLRGYAGIPLFGRSTVWTR